MIYAFYFGAAVRSSGRASRSAGTGGIETPPCGITQTREEFYPEGKEFESRAEREKRGYERGERKEMVTTYKGDRRRDERNTHKGDAVRERDESDNEMQRVPGRGT